MSRRIGIVTNDLSGVFQRAVIEGAKNAVAGKDVTVDVVRQYPSKSLAVVPEDYSGLLVIAAALPQQNLVQCFDADLPITLVSKRSTNPPIPSVMFNNAQGIQQLMRHLIVDCGCTAPVYVDGISDQLDTTERRNAFENERMRYLLPLDPTHILRGDFNTKTAAQSVLSAWRSKNRFDSVIAADFMMAIAVMDALHRYEVRVPEDVQVVGFGDGIAAENAGLTVVAADVHELGARAMRQLLYQIHHTPVRGTTTLSVELVMRDTTHVLEPISK